MMKIRCFGIAKDIIGESQLNISDEEQIKTVGHLKSWILENYPSFDQYKSFMIAVNEEYASDELNLSAQDDLAIIPPVSGG